MNTLSLRLALCAVLCVGLAASALAQQNYSGFYIGGNYGKSTLDTPTRSDRPGSSVQGYDTGSTAYGLFGGYQKSLGGGFYLGGEAGYNDNGYSTMTLSNGNRYKFISRQVNALATLSLWSGSGLFFHLKAGVGRVRELYRLDRYNQGSGTPDGKSTKTDTIPVAAIGIGYALNEDLAFFFDYQQTFGDHSNTVKKALKITNPNPPPEQNVLNSVARVRTMTFGISYIF